jgi:hypothetical protein
MPVIALTGLALLTILTFAASQIFYKSDFRQLDVTSNGFSTTIGDQSGTRKWSEIASIIDAPEFVLITGRNGNFMSIPTHAFSNSAEKQAFFESCNTWYAAANA